MQSREPKTTALLQVKSVPYSELVNTDAGSGARIDLAIFRPQLEQGWFYLGPCATNNSNQGGVGLIVKEIVPGTLADITKWKLIWSTDGTRKSNSYSIWRGVPPSSDYVVLGDFFLRNADPPTLEECKGMKAVRKDACAVASFGKRIWKDSGTGAKQDSSIRAISNDGSDELLLSGAFIAITEDNKAESMPYALDARKVLQKTA